MPTGHYDAAKVSPAMAGSRHDIRPGSPNVPGDATCESAGGASPNLTVPGLTHRGTAVEPMKHGTAKTTTLQFFIRHYVELMAALVVVFIGQTGLVPFDFAGIGGHVANTGFLISTRSHVTLPDLITNIFLYIPFGMFMHWTLRRRTSWRHLRWIPTVLLGAALSLAVEWIQSYSSTRVSSMIDWVANILGTAIGASFSWIAVLLVPRIVGTALVEAHHRPQATLLRIYIVGLVVMAAVPFSLSFDVGQLKRSVGTTVWMPFGASVAEQTARGNIGPEDQVLQSRMKLCQMKKWSRWSAECASFLVLAWLLMGVIRGDYAFAARTSVWLVWFFGVALAIGLSAMQFLIVSRVCDTTDILFRLTGLSAGVLTQTTLWRRRQQLGSAWSRHQTHQWVRRACALTVVYIAYTGLLPFDFSRPSGGLVDTMAFEGFLPFFAYQAARFDVMMDDVMEKFVSYALLAALMAELWSYRHDQRGVPNLKGILIRCLALSCAIDVCQIILPVRVPSLTDPIIAAGACFVGLVGQRYAIAFWKFAATDAVLVDSRRVRADGGRPALAPADALIASLMDPHPDAPVEQTPQPARRPRSPAR